MRSTRIEVYVSDIKPELVDKRKVLKDREQLQDISIIYSTSEYMYQYLDGRHRGEEVRESDPDGVVSALLFPDLTEDDPMFNMIALIGNSGKNNIPNEAWNCAQLRDVHGMSTKEIAEKSGLGWQTVNMRLNIYDGLIKPLFEMFQKGEIKQHGAMELIKMSKEEQKSVLNSIYGGFKPTGVNIKKFRRQQKAEKAEKIEKSFQVGKTKRIAAVIYEDALLNDIIEITTYDGQFIRLQKVSDDG